MRLSTRDLSDDPGLAPSELVSPRGPYVGTPPPKRVASFANEPRLDRLLLELHRGFGPQLWWPARTPFEVIAGAILTQNTNWSNVERALANVAALFPITPGNLLRADESALRAALVPSGYFNAKTRKLLAISRWYLESGGLAALRERALRPLRDELLGVWGVGPETADSILCYAAARRTAVVDTYARRILARHGFLRGDEPYEKVRSWLEERLRASQFVFEEFHALFVRAGYRNCKPKVVCDGCPATKPRDPGPAEYT